MTPEDLLPAIASARYAQLRTYRRDGRGVDTPIWFVLEGDTLTLRTKVGPKTRRIAANPAVVLWPCDYRGRYDEATLAMPGRAAILEGDAAEAANRALHRRYGWQYNVVPLLKVPGVANVDHELPLREKFRRVTSGSLWPDSAIIAVKLNLSAVKSPPPKHVSTQGG
jgi:PPOX class probable F420-dependent enzyme